METELVKMLKQEQIDLIKKLAGPNQRVPKLERDRVVLLLKLQKK